jgi:peptide-methionine (S)-S-oxide reductase
LTDLVVGTYLTRMTSDSRKPFIVVLLALLLGTTLYAGGGSEADSDGNSPRNSDPQSKVVPSEENARTAVFAGGCFWCMEEAYEKVPGVIDAVSGYTGGPEVNPSYYEVASGSTGHTEVVQVIYDPELVTYDELLYVFWRNIDLLDSGGQFCDRGSSYRTGVFYGSEEERTAAEATRQELLDSGRFTRPIATEITALDVFYEAEDYHQNYYETDPIRYSFYKSACGRERRLEQLWGDEAGGVAVSE